MKNRLTTSTLAILVVCASTASLLAHHSLANFDTTKAVRVKGTVAQYHVADCQPGPDCHQYLGGD